MEGTSEIPAHRQRLMPLDELRKNWRPGSFDEPWSWIDEDRWLWEKDRGRMHSLLSDITANGITEPISLGPDGRVWDGHHRVCIATFLGIHLVPVEVVQ